MSLSTYMSASFRGLWGRCARESDEDIFERAVGTVGQWSWYGIKAALQNPMTRKIRSTAVMKKIGSGTTRLVTGAMKKLGETRVAQTVGHWTGKAATKALELGAKTYLKTQIQSLAPEKPSTEPTPEGLEAITQPIQDTLAAHIPFFSFFASIVQKIFNFVLPDLPADPNFEKWQTQGQSQQVAPKPSLLSRLSSEETSLMNNLAEKYLNTQNLQTLVSQALTSCEEVLQARSQVPCPYGNSAEQMKDDLTQALLNETISFSDYETRVDALIEKGLDKWIEKESPQLNCFSKFLLKGALSALKKMLLSLVKESVEKNSSLLKARKAADIQTFILACIELTFCRAMEHLMKVWLGEKVAEPAKLDDTFEKVVDQIGSCLGYAVDYHVDTEKAKGALLSEEQREFSKEFEGLGTAMAHQAIDASTGLFSTIKPSHIFDEEVCDLIRKTITYK
jgi:hypothetical protein